MQFRLRHRTAAPRKTHAAYIATEKLYIAGDGFSLHPFPAFQILFIKHKVETSYLFQLVDPSSLINLKRET